MRFGVQLDEPSLSSLRSKVPRTSTYTPPSDSEDSSSEDELPIIASSDSEDSFFYASESEVPQSNRTRSTARGTSDDPTELTRAMASIRLHSEIKDPLEEWQKQNRREAFDAAQSRARKGQASVVNLFLSAAAITQRRVKQTQEAQIRSIDKILRDQRILREKEEAETRRKWEARSKEIWDQVDKAAIVVEARIEAERKAIQEEEDRIKREQEEKERVERERRERQEAERKRVEEEKKRVEEEKKQAEEAKRQAEEARKRAEEDKRKSEEQEAQRQLAEEARKKAEENLEKEKVALSHIEKERIQMGFTTPSEDWEATMDIINTIKYGHLQRVKSDSIQKREWAAARRGITVRIGQITEEEQSIKRVSTQIFDAIIAYKPGSDLYASCLLALAKVIIIQAETEVVGNLQTAGPLASVATNLLDLPGFSQVLWAEMAVRTGGWLVGHCVTKKRDQEEKVYLKLSGFRDEETPEDRQKRIGGVISTYFTISRSNKPLPVEFRPTKIWSFLTRIMSDPRLLRRSLAPHLMHSCLEAASDTGRALFGKQWAKLLFSMGQASVGNGIMGAEEDLGQTGRVLVQIKAEQLLVEMGALPS